MFLLTLKNVLVTKTCNAIKVWQNYYDGYYLNENRFFKNFDILKNDEMYDLRKKIFIFSEFETEDNNKKVFSLGWVIIAFSG